MLNPLRVLAPRSSERRLISAIAVAVAVIAALALPAGTPSAQQATLHLNPAIEKLAAGKPIFGFQTSDLSIANARRVARLNTDFIYVDLEHSPMDLPGLAVFVAAMNDKALTLAKGNAQPRSALIARFAPSGSDMAGWVVKQGLDIGLMGFMFNSIDTKEEALFAVRNMRYPPWKGRAYTGPIGIRGWSPTGALWAWGIGSDEYRRRADLWPINPEGDLLAFLAIETVEAVNNIDEIAAVPGISILHAAAGGDLSSSLGVPNNTPEVEAGRQKILKACLTHKVLCSIHVTGKPAIDQRLKEGWKVIVTESGTPNE